MGAMSTLHRLFKASPLPRLGFHLSQALTRVRRPVTLGVRTVVHDGDGRLCLIRHTYRPGWHFPGGGVKRWETLEQAALRETREEAGVAADRADRLIGLYANFRPERSDHVFLYEIRDWQPVTVQSLEIAEVAFFAIDDMPSDISGPTRRRLDEMAGRRVADGYW